MSERVAQSVSLFFVKKENGGHHDLTDAREIIRINADILSESTASLYDNIITILNSVVDINESTPNSLDVTFTLTNKDRLNGR